MIPQNITRDHIIEALYEIDKLGYSERREATGFYLRFNEKKYPPKVVISISNKFANGQELSSSTFSGGEETNTFLYSRGFEIITLSDEPVFTDQKVVDEGDEQNDFATRLKEYLERKFHIKVNRDGSRAPLVLPSGSQIYVRGSRELETDYDYYGYYHLVKRNYETIVKNQNQYFAVVYKDPTLTFIFNGDELKEIFGKYEPTIPKNRPPRWHFHIQENEGRYNLKLHNKQAKEYNIDSNLNKWDQINDFTGIVPPEEEEEEEDDEASYKADERIRITEIDYSSFLKSINLDNISKFEPHSLRNPERVKVNQIVQNCSKGIWVLPNFQRYFSWKKNHVKEFLESIFNDYYVGSLLFWDVAKELQLDIMPIKGSEVKKNELDPSLIILDGQQRITSLYYAIKAPGFHLQGTKSPVYFYINFHSFFNPETKGEIIEILNRKLTDKESFRRMLFPFYQLDEFNKWTYGLEDFMLNTSPENRDKIREVSRLIASKLWHIREGFEIPYISLPESMDVGQITDIFERTNTMGIKLNAFDLLIARLSKYNIELRKIWEEVIKRYPKFENYQKSTEKMPLYILQAISLFYDKNSACKRDDILNIYQRIFELSNMDFKETWDEMSEYMNKAIHKLENLRDGFGVKDEEQLPFSPTLPILAALIKEVGTRGNKIACNTMLGVWYWSSVFSNAYSGAVDSQLTSDFK
jgi:uncharacterized protein with ParB-like and HNH nuclease domain